MELMIAGVMIGWGIASAVHWRLTLKQEARLARRLDAMDAAEDLGLLTKRTGSMKPWDWPLRDDFPDRTEVRDDA